MGGQTGDKKQQMGEHETAGREELERDIATVTQQFEDVSTTIIEGIFG